MFDFMPLEFYSLCFACSTLIEIYGWPQKTGTPNWLGHFSKHAKDRADIYKCMCRIYTSTSLSAVLHLTFDQINLFAYKGRQTKALKKVCLNLLPENEKITQPTGRKNLSEWYKKSFHFCCSVLRVPFLSVPLFFFFVFNKVQRWHINICMSGTRKEVYRRRRASTYYYIRASTTALN